LIEFLIRRITYSIVVIFVVSVVVFAAIHSLPGDPIEIMLQEFANPVLTARLRAHYLLDQPIYVQYGHWIRGILTGEWGISIRTQRPILATITKAMQPSLIIALGGWIVSSVVGVVLGTVAALKRGTIIDYMASVSAFVGLSTPAFFYGLILMLIFGLRLRWFPSSGYVFLQDAPLETMSYVVLPILAIGLRMSAAITRISRTAVLEVIGEDYVKTARAKGLREGVVIIKHVLRSSMITIVTVSGLQLGVLLGGVVILENVFAIPGLGSLVVNGTFFRDYPIIQACVLVFSVWFTAINVVVDFSYSMLDPRIHYG